MGLFDGILGGLVGAGVQQALSGYIQRNGGVQELVRQFEAKGLGGIVNSWVSTGPNQPVSADQLRNVLGSERIAEFAGKLGVNEQQLLDKLTELLPQTVDKMTPNGVIPKH